MNITIYICVYPKLGKRCGIIKIDPKFRNNSKILKFYQQIGKKILRGNIPIVLYYQLFGRPNFYNLERQDIVRELKATVSGFHWKIITISI